MEIATRWLNLVFQGGGVRGIAYAGGLARMPAHYRIHAVGGRRPARSSLHCSVLASAAIN